jgi:hypothetical protein
MEKIFPDYTPPGRNGFQMAVTQIIYVCLGEDMLRSYVVF